MLEIIKGQYKSGRSLSQIKYYRLVNPAETPKFMRELYPLALNYYHELNPFFVASLHRPALSKFAPLTTVRDGYVYFASYLVNNFSSIMKSRLHYLIHPDLAPLVPSNIADQFACWQMAHAKKIEIQESKKVIIFGFMAEQYLGTIEDIERRLGVLKDLPQDVLIEAYLPIRGNPLRDTEFDKESVLLHQTIGLIKDAVPNHKIHFITGEQLIGRSDYQRSYFLDLAHDNFLISDNYLHYYICARGGSVNLIPKNPPSNAIFELDLSLHHKLYVTPLPKTDSIFADLIFHKKKYPGRELERDPLFQTLLRMGLKTVN